MVGVSILERLPDGGGVAEGTPLAPGPALLELVALADGVVGGLWRIVVVTVAWGPGFAELLLLVTGASAADGKGTVAKTGVPPCAA